MRPLFLFAPGAGAPSTSEWMQRWATRLATVGRVVPFDYAYSLAGKRRPDPLPALIATHRRALAAARREGEPVVLIGKSMGSRVGCHLSLEESVSSLVCLGYPLVAAAPSKTLRAEVLAKLKAPVLFVQGTRDPLCPLDRLAEARAAMTAESALHVVESGDHSLAITAERRKREATTQEAVDAATLGAIARFVATRYLPRRISSSANCPVISSHDGSCSPTRNAETRTRTTTRSTRLVCPKRPPACLKTTSIPGTGIGSATSTRLSIRRCPPPIRAPSIGWLFERAPVLRSMTSMHVIVELTR